MNCATGDKNANFGIAAPLIEKAAAEGAKLIVLPELFNTGYCCTEDDWKLSEAIGEETECFLKDYAVKFGCSLIGGFVERSGVNGMVFNSLMLVTPDSETRIYRKIYLWGAEKNRFIKGSRLEVWNTPEACVAPFICYETGFPEIAKLGALNGAQILCCSAAFGGPRLYAWDLATRARALETGCYVLASNHSESENGLEFCGHSRIIDPSGNVICETTEENQVIIADLELDKVADQRNSLPYLRDINTEFTAEGFMNVKK